MNRLSRHLTKCLLAGVVTLLPVAALALGVAYVELSISRSGVSRLPFYFPGLGIVLAVAVVYLVGLTTTTLIGHWLWSWFDRLLRGLPALGKIYASLQQILGYGQGKDAMFQRTVLVPSRDKKCEELGLVTNEITLPDGSQRLIVFLPGTPNPTAGRLVITTPDEVRSTDIPVHEALKNLVAVGKTQLRWD
ncbi:MAG: DUF502 domain-containing protein [Thermoguttaceae bacterium]